jgi:ankyrin repeat protein
MSRELIDAAAAGDINNVKQLLRNSEIEVNYVGSIRMYYLGQLTKNKRSCTALSAATNRGHLDIVKLLLEHGAKVAPSESTPSEFANVHINALWALMLNGTIKIGEAPFAEIVCLILRHCPPNLSLEIDSGVGPLLEEDWGLFSQSMSRSNDSVERVSLLLLRSIADNNVHNMELLIKAGANPPTLASLKTFLDAAPVDKNFANELNKGIEYLTENKHIANEIGEQLKRLVDKSVFERILGELPVELKPFLSKSSSRTLLELFANFRALFFPEERLPLIPVDSASFKFDEDIDKEFYADETQNQDSKTAEETIKKIIRSKQHPMELNKLLALDQKSILIRLGVCAEEAGINNAVLLLAEIVLFHHDAKFTLDSNPVILLDEEKLKTCRNLLTGLYSLTDTEKLLMIHHQRQQEQLNRLEKNNLILSKQIGGLEENALILSKQVSVLSEQNEKIIAMLGALLKEKQSEKLDPQQSPYTPVFYSTKQ